ncbi:MULTISPECIES: hypothetical protein [Actinomycetes]|uniref:hypothetical protein n=1 Tax=Actinomycetes TaxID=1760 RepID=UPI0006612ADB|nr:MULTISPECIES: hypothetical protein [Actinomycetes]UUO93787.1 hypothetical protein NQK35_01305 [Schaalia odontolytica]
MKSHFRLFLPMLVVAALTAACNPFTPKASAPQYPQDPRFSEFVFDFNEEPKVQTRVDSLNLRWPKINATEAHVVVEYSRSGIGVPQTEPEFWITAVATVPDETIAQLINGSIGDSSLLPGIYPGLYEYVPQDCHFTNIDTAFANDRLGVDLDEATKGFAPIDITGLAASEDCNLIVITALGHSFTPPSYPGQSQ